MSTFSVFRKNQKTWLAVLGVLTMLSFVFIPTLEQCNRHFMPGNQAHFKSKAFGNLSYSQFQQESMKQNSIYPYIPTMNNRVTENTIASTWLKAKYAEKLGFVVSDDEISKFVLKVFGSVKAYQDALKKSKITPSSFEDGLKEILLAQKYETYCLLGFSSPRTVEQQWRLFCNVYRKATINAIPIRAENYLAKAPTPTKDQIKKFFEANKKVCPDRKEGTVGFKSPRKVRIQYLVYEDKSLLGNTPFPDPEPVQEGPEEVKLDEITPEEVKLDEITPEEVKLDEITPEEITGDTNTGDANTGDANTGDANTGDANTGDANTGDANTGDANTGDANTGDANTGDANTPEPSADARTQNPFRLVSDETVTTEQPRNEDPVEKFNSQEFLKLVQTDLSSYKSALEYDFSSNQNPKKTALEFSAETKAYMDKYKIQLKELDLMDMETLAEQDIAKTYGFANLGDKTFTGIECRDFTNVYIVWISEDIPEEEPKELTEEIARQVEKAWKLEEAKKLAAEDAQKKAGECAKANKLTGNTAPIEIKDFARYIPFGKVPRPINLDYYKELENVGEEFRTEVFQMLPGEIKALPNHSRTVFYVTQLKTFEPNNEKLRADFNELKSSPDHNEMINELYGEELEIELMNWQNSIFENAGASFTKSREEE